MARFWIYIAAALPIAVIRRPNTLKDSIFLLLLVNRQVGDEVLAEIYFVARRRSRDYGKIPHLVIGRSSDRYELHLEAPSKTSQRAT